MKKKMIVVGSGTHSEVVLDIIEKCNEYEVVGLIDDNNREIFGYKVIGDDNSLIKLYEDGVRFAFIAIGENLVREKLFYKLIEIGYEIINVISDKAIISSHASIGKGVLVMPGGIINCCAQIGNGVIINTNSSVDHDCTIGDFVHIAPGSSIAGTTFIGKRSFVGVGSSIKDKITIGNDVIIGAGSVVINDIESYKKVYGVPAK